MDSLKYNQNDVHLLNRKKETQNNRQIINHKVIHHFHVRMKFNKQIKIINHQIP